LSRQLVSPDALLDVLRHVRAQRALASALLHGLTRAILIRVLALKLERQLAALARRSARRRSRRSRSWLSR